jgi:hypothetical protein
MHAASTYAGALLRALPAAGAAVPPPRSEHPAIAWARSGAMALTGRAEEAPRLAPGPLATCAAAALDALRSLSDAPPLAAGIDGAALLGERAAHLGLARRGAVSPGGGSRLLRCADGWLAVSLARDDDRRMIPAWLEGDCDPASDAWAFVADAVSERKRGEVVARARLLGLSAAEVASGDDAPPPWVRITRGGVRGGDRRPVPLVLDLSALWAGPLCGRLLALAGARVVKVESAARPDGARRGPAGFYDALNAGKESVALDLGSARGKGVLRRLVARADAVVESSRPRALAQLGIDAEVLVAERPGLVWASVTGYGRREPEGAWVAFGDEACAASGLAAKTGDPDAPLFCGDAIADPLTGLHAAVATLAHLRAGEGALLALALRDVAAHCLAAGDAREGAFVAGEGERPEVVAGGTRAAVAAPRTALPAGRARSLGADTAAVLSDLGIRC